MSLEGIKIVAIDDTPSIRTFLRVSLEDEGAEFYEASTANEGLDLCKRIVPDLVVLDLGLPDIDGLDILPEIKGIKPNNKMPVLVLSVRKARETVKEAFEKGANGYLTKPFMVEDLLEIIEEKLPYN
ncbi:response regulator [Kiloniella majae]|uniref:response regulator n=1 Tax=Kiloniella majae TaxID=1938558 RepID=UPI000A2791EA|nr:response regulator [Kiloniella majae]